MILDGKTTAKTIRRQLADEITQHLASARAQSKQLSPPRLDIILVGDDFASKKYVSMKQKIGQEIGIDVKLHVFAQETKQDEILELIKQLNIDEMVSGIMVQLPLPDHIDKATVLNSVEPVKDVDGLTAGNKEQLNEIYKSRVDTDEDIIDKNSQMNTRPLLSSGRTRNSRQFFPIPATPTGIMLLLQAYGIEVAGKKAVVVGRSELVGAPMAKLLSIAGANVEVGHSQTEDLSALTRTADLLVVAVGKAGLISAKDVKDGVVVVDVGINRQETAPNQIVGDVDFESVSQKASYITPVPGGVGPMTVAALMWNTVQCWKTASE